MIVRIKARSSEAKREPKRIRREGDVPAALYVRGKDSASVIADGEDFRAALRATPKGRLATTIFTLKTEDGKEKKAIIKDIQYHPTNYDILHIDFEELDSKHSVKLNVPIECTGVIDCQGVKLGGALRQILRTIRVQCPSTKIPSHFELNVKELGRKEKMRVKDIALPEGVTLLVDANLPAVTVG